MIKKPNGQIESSGKSRQFLLYIPESYNPAVPTPLVISLHGFMQWPGHLMQISHWNEIADAYGFIVVYPSGTGFPKRWNIHNWSGASMPISREVQFISDLIDDLGKHYNIDPTRVYANGLSIGGGMAFLLACRLSERITAIGSVCGAYLIPLDECQRTRPVPAIVFHGTADPIVPYQGSELKHLGSSLPALPTWVLNWALRNSCDFVPEDLPSIGDVSGVRYINDSEDADVVFYTIHGGGHTWPGGKPIPRFVAGSTTKNIDATCVMWDFFSQFALE